MDPEFNYLQYLRLSIERVGSPITICFASKEMQDNENLLFEAVSINGQALKYASVRLKANRELVKCAILNDGNALEYASADLRSDNELRAMANW